MAARSYVVDAQGREALLVGYVTAFLVGALLTVEASATFTAYTFGKILGVWSLTALTFQILLVARTTTIDRAIGYDRVTRWHAMNGVLIMFLVLSHPLTIFSRQLMNLNVSAVIGFVQNTPAAVLGEVAVLLVFVQLVTTVYWTGLDYERWRIIHRIGYIVVALGFVHSFLLGTDISLPPGNLLSVWWLFLAAVVVGSVLYRYGYRPLRKKQRFRVVNVQEEATGVYTVELVPVDDGMQHEPGQFAFVTFESDHLPAEEHHFTISSAPDRDGFTYTIKESGDFTADIDQLTEGDTAIVEGPYGGFTLDEEDGPITLIAGGIGITPFMSMIRHMDRAKGRETRLIYGNRTVEDIVFQEELERLEERNDWLTVTHVLSEEAVDGFEHGRIGRDVLESTDTGSQYYICGPPAMMDAVENTLRELGVPSSRIRTERFSLREMNWRRILPF